MDERNLEIGKKYLHHRKLEIDGRKLEAERWDKCIDLTQEGGTFQHEYEVFTLTHDQIKEELL